MNDAVMVLLHGVPAGTLTRLRSGTQPRLEFRYDDAYARDPLATPLSISMPLGIPVHPHGTMLPWIEGLLPEDLEVRRRWARTFDTSSDPYSLLSTSIGEDCPGAVSFVLPQRLDVVASKTGAVQWLSEAEVAGRLRELSADRTSWLGNDFAGRFSLAGAQAKTALLLEGGQWGVPSGPTPTTHIFKLAIPGLDDHDVNEHLCLQAAKRCGMLTASSTIETFEDQQAIVIKRYDRRVVQGSITRVHQEDLCQAMGVSPVNKYQSDGGPSSTAIARVLARVISRPVDDLVRFVDALMFNWFIGGTDAHAKNYSLLLLGSSVRLAPLYDISSALPYADVHVRKLRLAMKLAGSYLIWQGSQRIWAKIAAELGLAEELIITRARALITQIPDAFADAAQALDIRQLPTTMPTRLVDAVATRTKECAQLLP